MKNVLLTRIDDRLIHGQVVTAWIKVFPINKILIIDDALSKDQLMSRIYRAAAPMSVEVIIKNREESWNFLKEPALKDENLMILVKVPERIEELLDNGIPLNKVILGGMGASKTRKKFNRNISASDEEVNCFKRIIDKGTEIYYQLVPNDRPLNIETLF